MLEVNSINPKPMQKVIFLDIDGVMNSHIFYEQRHRKRWLEWRTYYFLIRRFLGIKSKPVSLANYKTPKSYYTYQHRFKRLKEETCQQKWKWLANFCNETGTKICVSSVWRFHFRNEESVKPLWWERALIDLGFNEGTFVGITDRLGMRGEEIKDWLQKNQEVQDYAILDDDSDMLPEQMDKFYHCDGYFGLSPNHLYRIQRAFSGKSKYGHLNKTV
jgi:hypothetical protein